MDEPAPHLTTPGSGNGSSSGPELGGGLARRAMLCHHAEKSLARLRRDGDRLVAVLVLRLEGAGAGGGGQEGWEDDAALEEVCARVRDCLREMDVVAPLAADEIGVLLAGLKGESDPRRVAARLRHCVAQPGDLAGGHYEALASIGIAIASDERADAEDLFGAAGEAAERAAARGTGRIRISDPEVHVRTVARAAVEARIRKGLQRDDLALHYQPIVELDTGRVEAVEALLHWDLADGEPTLPVDVIPVAEETGLILPLCWWTLETACRQAVAWAGRLGLGVAPRISVNISADHLAQPRFLSLLDRILERTGHPAGRLDLEISESAVMRDPDAARTIMRSLRERGIRLLLDDFGSGCSSLPHLSRLPLDAVKIDRSFVWALEEGAEDVKAVRTMIALARSLDLKVVAEGVETARQRSLVTRLGCEYAQGYRLRPPLGPSLIEDLLRAS